MSETVVAIALTLSMILSLAMLNDMRKETSPRGGR
ncbi:hypothetical protein ES703_31566 [subsurface metagenome]